MAIKFANNAYSTLASSITNSATSITLTTGEGARFPSFSAPDYFLNLEIVKCTTRSTDVLTVVRAQESTTARAYAAGDRIELRITAGVLDALYDAITYSAGSSSTLGLIKLEDNATQTTAASDITTTATRTYGLQINSSGQGVVNVPWVDTDTNTTYSVQDGELSQNNLTNTLKGYYDTGHTHSQAAHAPSGAEANAANTAITTATQTFTAGQRGEITAITSTSAALTSNFNDSNNFSHTLTENTTLSLPSNVTAGQSGSYFITQHASSAKTLGFNTAFKFAGGTVPDISTATGSVDRLDYVVKNDTSSAEEIHAVLSLNIKNP